MLKQLRQLLLLVLFSASAQPVFCQMQDSIKMILDLWEHDSEWVKSPYFEIAHWGGGGLPYNQYHYYEKIRPQLNGKSSKLLLYFETSKILTERALGLKNGEEIKNAALKLLPLALNVESPFARIWYYQHLGDFCLRAGELEKAVYYQLLAVDLCEQTGPKYHAPTMLLNIYFVTGRALYQTREHERSLQYMQKALRNLKDTPEQSVSFEYLNNTYTLIYDLIGSNYQRMGKYEQALSYYNKISERINRFKLDTNSRYKFWKGLVRGKMGQLFLAQGNYNEALGLIQEGLSASIEYNDGMNSCEFYENRAKIKMLTGDYSGAIADGKKAATYLVHLTYPDKMASDIYEVLYKTYIKLKQYPTAVGYLERYHKHKDAHQRQLETSELKKIEVGLSYDKIRQQNTERASEISKLTWLRNSLIALVILVLIISVLLYWNFKLKQERKLKSIALEQEKAELEKRTALMQVEHFKQSIFEKEELIAGLQHKVTAIGPNADEVPESLKNFTLITEEGWNTFRMDFIKAYPGFLKTLRSRHGELSSAEERLAMLIFLKLDNIKIAHSVGISKDSVGKAKRRLRTLLGFESNELMEEYIVTVA